MSLDTSLLDILACPSDDHAPLRLDEEAEELLCTACDRAYPIRDGIPVLLLDEARHREASADVEPSEETTDSEGDAE